MLDRSATALAVIDMQEGFRKVMADYQAVARRIAILVRGARLLELPIVWCEQYPKGLGRSAPEVAEAMPDGLRPIEKKTFSGCGVPETEQRLRDGGARAVLVCGIETHVCVNQTVHDLLAAGFTVHVMEDAVSSRNPADRDAGLKKMYASGAVPGSVEMALFEMMRTAEYPRFREVQRLLL
jgi:nicotinamidase-related amidase